MNRTSRCGCGQIGIQVEGDPVSHIVCHCDNCKQRTRSAFGYNTYYKTIQVKSYIGEATVYNKTNGWGEQTLYFCGNCGTTVYATLKNIEGITFVAAGRFADDPLGEPNRTVTCGDRACEWVTLPDYWDRTESSWV